MQSITIEELQKQLDSVFSQVANQGETVFVSLDQTRKVVILGSQDYIKMIERLKKAGVMESSDWLDECFGLMDLANVNSHGSVWNRDELYEI